MPAGHMSVPWQEPSGRRRQVAADVPFEMIAKSTRMRSGGAGTVADDVPIPCR